MSWDPNAFRASMNGICAGSFCEWFMKVAANDCATLSRLHAFWKGDNGPSQLITPKNARHCLVFAGALLAKPSQCFHEFNVGPRTDLAGAGRRPWPAVSTHAK
jgi:hypothetical protein